MEKPVVATVDIRLVKKLLKDAPKEVQEYVRALEHLTDVQEQTIQTALRKIRELAGREVAGEWVAFDPKDSSTWPKEYGKYFVCRNDGKIHWETWNGTGWAYNHTVVVRYAKINHPMKGGAGG